MSNTNHTCTLESIHFGNRYDHKYTMVILVNDGLKYITVCFCIVGSYLRHEAVGKVPERIAMKPFMPRA